MKAKDLVAALLEAVQEYGEDLLVVVTNRPEDAVSDVMELNIKYIQPFNVDIQTSEVTALGWEFSWEPTQVKTTPVALID